eukprot:8231837-Alexandrium_andersonii.AAC.1
MPVKPECFRGDANQSWRKWRARFENYVSGVDSLLLEESAKATRPITVRAMNSAAHNVVEIEARQKMNVKLYTELASLLSGKPGQIAKDIYEKSGSKNGFELWRQLNAEYEPKAGERMLAWVRQILEGDVLKGATAYTFEEKLLSWERLVEEYEEESYIVLESDLKRAVLIKSAPAETYQHLALTMEVLDTYDKMRSAIIRYCK